MGVASHLFQVRLEALEVQDQHARAGLQLAADANLRAVKGGPQVSVYLIAAAPVALATILKLAGPEELLEQSLAAG
jgi:hypothetical protein